MFFKFFFNESQISGAFYVAFEKWQMKNEENFAGFRKELIQFEMWGTIYNFVAHWKNKNYTD